MWTFKTMIINASIAEQARALAEQLSSSAKGMWTTPLSATGIYPATHYISTGMIGVEFASMLESAQGLVEGAFQLGITIDLATAEYLLNNADISDEEPFVAMEQLGLQMINEEV